MAHVVKQSAIGNSKFTLVRRGDFRVLTLGPNHCGTVPDLAVKYTLQVSCQPDSLDNRGFLFNQVMVKEFFQGLRQTALSCEQLTLWCGRQLFKKIIRENRGCKIKRFMLTLSPAPYEAELTFEWAGA